MNGHRCFEELLPLCMAVQRFLILLAYRGDNIELKTLSFRLLCSDPFSCDWEGYLDDFNLHNFNFTEEREWRGGLPWHQSQLQSLRYRPRP